MNQYNLTKLKKDRAFRAGEFDSSIASTYKVLLRWGAWRDKLMYLAGFNYGRKEDMTKHMDATQIAWFDANYILMEDYSDV